MKTFREYYEDKEHEQINEELTTAIIAGLFGLPAGLTVLGWGASIIYKYARMNTKKFSKMAKTWRDFKDLFRSKNPEKKIKKTAENMRSSPEVKKAERQVDKLREKYAEPLKEIYEAIENKNPEEAKELVQRLEDKYKNNPEVKTALIDKILEVYKEPPIYIKSPGNDTYAAINKIVGKKEAEALKELTRLSFSHYYDEEEESEE